MDEDRLEELIEEAEGGDISPSEYRSAVEDLDVERSEEAFLKATGMALISRGRAEEVRDMSEALLSEKRRTDDVFETVLEELDGMEEVYTDHMEDLDEKFSYSAEVWKEVEENLREAGGDVYVDIDIHVEGDTIHNHPGDRTSSHTGDGGDSGDLLDEDKRDSLRTLLGAGVAAAGIGGGLFGAAAAYDELTDSEGVSTVEAPDSYTEFYDEMDFLGFADELQDSNQDLLVNIGDDMENILEEEPHVDYGLGLKDGNLFLDWGNNARRYSMGDHMAEIEQTVDDYLEQ